MELFLKVVIGVGLFGASTVIVTSAYLIYRPLPDSASYVEGVVPIFGFLMAMLVFGVFLIAAILFRERK